MAKGDFVGKDVEAVSAQFGEFTANAPMVVGFMFVAVIIGFVICSFGLQKGVEKITKTMMLALLGIILVLAIRSMTLSGAGKGLSYYLVPDFNKMKEQGIGNVIFAAMGQAFFTLSIGMGSMAIFGSYISKERRLAGETLSIALLDTFVAFCAGLIIIPACFAYNIEPGAGPGLIFETLPNIFNNMPGGRIWGSLFFVFMIFAAISTVVAVFENIISFAMDKGMSRKKACIVNFFAILLLSLPCAFGFNILSFITPLGKGSTILDLEDFIISNNILPLGSLIYVLFCTSKKYGWGWDNFIKEANTGKGIKFPVALKIYAKYILPVILVAFWIMGIVNMFIK